MTTAEDTYWMQQALALARKGEGCTRPNPPVGAVLVKNGRLIGQGWHRRAGKPHAEIEALKNTGTDAAGATLYVTLEPCSTWGRTPPCTDALIAARLKRVVAAILDPNPLHSGNGLKILRRAGLAVSRGSCAQAAAELIAPFACRVKTGRPFLTLKLAMTLDGRIADRNGRSKWITGSASRTAVQALRRRADAIMVGVDTVLRDDPSLWPRPARGRRPLRIIVDTMGRSRLDAQVLSDRHAGQTVIATTRQCPPRRVDAFRRCGADVWVLPGKKQVSLKLLLKKAGQQGLLHILCEGGGLLAESLLQQQLVDRGEFFYAPKVAGDDRALSAFRGRGWLLPAMPRFAVMSVECLAPDVRVTVRPQGKPGTP